MILERNVRSGSKADILATRLQYCEVSGGQAAGQKSASQSDMAPKNGVACFSARNYDDAVAAFKTVRGEAQNVQAWLAACHAHMGNREAAEAASAAFLAITTKLMAQVGVRPPTNWGSFFTDRRHPYKHADDRNHLLDGLRKAGLPA